MTKKTLVSMITGALVIGAASTTFAAANPFSDVPADSWAYDAVSKLASDGIVNGYPDGTYKGEKTMTRYEMAQIVAKAMTKTDMDKADKALVDKLAAEFSEELDNLGVRVSDLEKKSDNVKWTGRMSYIYAGTKNEDSSGVQQSRENKNTFRLRLTPEMFVGNSGWSVKARINYYNNASSSSNGGSVNGNDTNGGTDKSNTVVDQIYAQGPLFGATAKLGKLDTYSDDVMGSGLIMDDNISGAQFKWHVGDKDGNSYVKAVAGRYDFDSDSNKAYASDNVYDGTGDYFSFEVGIAPKNSKLSGLLGYYTLRNVEAGSFASDYAGASMTDEDNTGIWAAGLGYQFDKNVKLYGIYAKSDMDEVASYTGDAQDKSYDIQLAYKGADMTKKGSWGAYAAYRYLGEFASIAPTYDAATRGTKGWEIGANYTVAENIVATIRYYDGKNLSASNATDDDFSKVYGEVDFWF